MHGGPYYLSNNRFDHSECLPIGEYQFNIYDNGGNGLANDEHIDGTIGQYNVYMNDVLIGNGIDFGASESLTFSVAVPTPTSSLSPTQYYTSSPTLLKPWVVFESIEVRKLSHNTLIGEFKPLSSDYELSFTIIPHGIKQEWGSIIRFTSSPDSGK